jgi:hypothetical protein
MTEPAKNALQDDGPQAAIRNAIDGSSPEVQAIMAALTAAREARLGATTPKPQDDAPVDPAKVRKRLTFPLKISDGVVQMRRVDLLNLVLTGKMEARLLHAAQAMERSYAQVSVGVKTSADVINEMTPAERLAMLEVLHNYAVIAVVSPRYTLTDTGQPGELPVDTLLFNDLLKIYNAEAPADVAVDPHQPVAAPTTEEGAARFREAAPEPRAADRPVPERADAAPRIEGVAMQTVGDADAGVVELAHL